MMYSIVINEGCRPSANIDLAHEKTGLAVAVLSGLDDVLHRLWIHDNHWLVVAAVDVFVGDSQAFQPVRFSHSNFGFTCHSFNLWLIKILQFLFISLGFKYSSDPLYRTISETTQDRMTNYIVEVYKKGARSPYLEFGMSLPNASRPTYTKYEECFGGKLDRYGRVKIRYAKNRGLVAEKYFDSKKNGRLRWYRK